MRKVPRPFTMHWGEGEIIEEAAFRGKYHEPALQLMKFEDGDLCIRFCYYRKGRFQRGPLMLGKDEAKRMKTVIRKCPQLRAFLKKIL